MSAAETRSTIIGCECGWRSRAMTDDELHAIGIPWWCPACDRKAKFFVHFTPREVADANRVIGEWTTRAQVMQVRRSER